MYFRFKCCETFDKLNENTCLCNDIKELNPVHQTSNVEGFRALITHFCPKMYSATKE